jgi:hypothetical protein
MDQFLTPFFKLSEFNKNISDPKLWVKPRPELLHVLQKLRERTGESVLITDGARTIQDHIETYKKIATRGGKHWTDVIVWTSRHLPAHGHSELRAVDIKCKSGKDFLTGAQVRDKVLEIVNRESFKELFGECFWGFGVGKKYLHLDTGDRLKNAEWGYDY